MIHDTSNPNGSLTLIMVSLSAKIISFLSENNIPDLSTFSNILCIIAALFGIYFGFKNYQHNKRIEKEMGLDKKSKPKPPHKPRGGGKYP